MVLWRGDRINGWVAGIASHGSGFLSRGWLDTIEAPVGISDAVDNRTLSRASKVSHLQICLWDQNSHIFLFPGFFQQH